MWIVTKWRGGAVCAEGPSKWGSQLKPESRDQKRVINNILKLTLLLLFFKPRKMKHGEKRLRQVILSKGQSLSALHMLLN